MVKSTYASRYVMRTRFMVLLYHNIHKFARLHVCTACPLFSYFSWDSLHHRSEGIEIFVKPEVADTGKSVSQE
jgi:hypothetical protein